MAAGIWTSTQGTAADKAGVPKIIQYNGYYYYACAINTLDDVCPRDSSFIYEAMQRRIEDDRPEIEKTIALIAPYVRSGAIESVTWEKVSETAPFWSNTYFSYADARAAVGLTAAYKPRRILEVGIGNSTKFFRLAVNAYSKDTRIISIDPHPRADVSQLADEIYEKSVFQVDLSVFQSLEAGDILFWDGSHIVGNGTDISRLFLEIIPILKPGVFVHIHDVSLPYEAFAHEAYGDFSHPEQYILGAYLIGNRHCKIILPNHYLSRSGRGFEGGSSFWFRL